MTVYSRDRVPRLVTPMAVESGKNVELGERLQRNDQQPQLVQPAGRDSKRRRL